jgi:dihydroneopterin aldolase
MKAFPTKSFFLKPIASRLYAFATEKMRCAFTDCYELLVPGLRLWIALGCSAEERTHPQPVDVDIRINFAKQPVGCLSDKLSDVSCYKRIAEEVIESVKGRSFHLIEFLAAQIFDVVAKEIGPVEAGLEVTITKPNHPVPHIQKGIVFKYRRSLPQKRT